MTHEKANVDDWLFMTSYLYAFFLLITTFILYVATKAAKANTEEENFDETLIIIFHMGILAVSYSYLLVFVSVLRLKIDLKIKIIKNIRRNYNCYFKLLRIYTTQCF